MTAQTTLVFLFLLVSIATTHSFLFDSSTKSPTGTGNGLSEQQYRDLLDLIMQERRYRRQIEQYVSGTLQQELGSLKNETSNLRETYQNLKTENNFLHGMLSSLENKTGSYDHMDELEMKLNGTIESTKSKIRNLESLVTQVSNNVSSALSVVSTEVKNISVAVEGNGQRVSFQACGGVPYYEVKNNYPSGIKMTFTDIKYSRGIKNLTSLKTTGEFIIDTPGVYLFVANVGGSKSNRRFSIVLHDASRKYHFLSSAQVTPYYTRKSYTDMYHTATAAAVVDLKVNDTVYVDVQSASIPMNTHSAYNCISIVKLH